MVMDMTTRAQKIALFKELGMDLAFMPMMEQALTSVPDMGVKNYATIEDWRAQVTRWMTIDHDLYLKCLPLVKLAQAKGMTPAFDEAEQEDQIELIPQSQIH